MQLDTRSKNVLLCYGKDVTPEIIAGCTAAEIMRLPNAGPTTVRKIQAWLEGQGLSLAGMGPSWDVGPNIATLRQRLVEIDRARAGVLAAIEALEKVAGRA